MLTEHEQRMEKKARESEESKNWNHAAIQWLKISDTYKSKAAENHDCKYFCESAHAIEAAILNLECWANTLKDPQERQGVENNAQKKKKEVADLLWRCGNCLLEKGHAGEARVAIVKAEIRYRVLGDEEQAERAKQAADMIRHMQREIQKRFIRDIGWKVQFGNFVGKINILGPVFKTRTKAVKKKAAKSKALKNSRTRQP